MRVAVFDVHRFEKPVFEKLNSTVHHSLTYFEPRLNSATAELAGGFDAVCSFVNDRLDFATLTLLKDEGIRLIALRSAGFNHVDLATADRLGLKVVRVPAYSPHAVAEHAVCLILALNRKIHRSFARVREANFSLDGLVGFDLHGKTVGVIGTGRIGAIFARIMSGFGCKVLAYDVEQDPELATQGFAAYASLDEIYRQSDILSLHVPLNPATRHLIDARAITLMKPGAMLINTGRGALIDTPALVQGLKSGRIGAAGLDVYEEEENFFFRDLSDQVLQDDVLARLLTFPNVLVTAHQAFLTQEALANIVTTTLENISDFEAGRPLKNEVRVQTHTSKS